MSYTLIRILILAAACCCVAGGAAAADPSPAGHYVLSGVPEMGSQLLLAPDGQFEYMLAYGAYDEYAKGKWQLKGRQVILNTEGKAIPPRFVLAQSGHEPEPVVSVKVVDPQGNGMALIDVLLDLDGSGGHEGYTQRDGYNVQADRAAAPKLIALAVKMYKVDWQAFKDLPPTHNHYVFRFEPGTLGQAQFRDLAFDWEGDTLTVVREGQRMRYRKQ